MAVNQPKIGKDQVDNSWKLEVTTQANNEEARVNDLASRLATLEAMMGTGTGGGIVRSVDDTGILRFNEITGRLSSAQVSSTGTLSVDNYVQMLSSGTNIYTFSGADTNGPILDRSLVFVGGLKLIESVDYNVTGANQITLLRSPTVDSDSMIELTVWSLT